MDSRCIALALEHKSTIPYGGGLSAYNVLEASGALSESPQVRVPKSISPAHSLCPLACALDAGLHV